MDTTLENKHGYLLLTDSGDGTSIYYKANKITAMIYARNDKICVYDATETGMVVEETIDEIFAQLENIHPNLR